MLKQAKQKDQAFLDDLALARSDKDSLHIWWMGQSGFLVSWSGTTILFDPYLSDSLTAKYAGTEKSHVRMTERVVDPSLLTEIDIMTSTHNHSDHLDGETLKALIAANPDCDFVIPEANRDFVADRLGCDCEYPEGVVDLETIEVKGVRVTGIPAAHSEIERDGAGRCVFLGYVMKLGPWTLYHSGDTLWYDGLEEILQPLGVDVAFLPINGDVPERKIAGNLNGAQAAKLAKAIGAQVVFPCHYDMFAFNTESPELFETTCREIGQEYRVVLNGERVSFKR